MTLSECFGLMFHSLIRRCTSTNTHPWAYAQASPLWHRHSPSFPTARSSLTYSIHQHRLLSGRLNNMVAVNKTEEWVLGPENTPFFTTTVSVREGPAAAV